MVRKKIYPVILLIAIISGIEYNACAGELINPRLGATYVKSSDGTKRITISLSASIDDKRVNIMNAQLQISAVNESEKTLIGTVVTDQKGKAFLDIKSGTSIPEDKEGNYTFDIRFAGNQAFDSVSKTLQVKDVNMELSFYEKDTIKNVLVKVYAVNEKGTKNAVRDVPVEFYVLRLFCLYRFGDEKTDSSGLCTAEFPKNMPGDTTGKVIIVAKILENDTYGTVETIRNYTGGKPLIIEPQTKRGLGDTDAPLWMVYTLLVLLSGVWIHVLYVISLVIRINITGKKQSQL
jgi:uncharacterized FlaG/YvyC family protein